jgi:hypothetical protein
MAKPKATRKTIHKTKKTNTVHPHIECIQAEITALEEKLVKNETNKGYTKNYAKPSSLEYP